MAPATTFPEVEKHVLSDIYTVSRSPLVGGTALDSLLNFYSSLVRADRQIATHLVPNLVIAAEKAPSKGECSPGNAARCVAMVVKSDQGVAAGTIKEYSKYIKVGWFGFYGGCTSYFTYSLRRKRNNLWWY